MANLAFTEVILKHIETKYDLIKEAGDLVALKSTEANHLRCLVEEEAYWRQNSRIKWLNKEDRNISFFHAAASCKKSVLSFSSVKNSSGQ